MATRLRAKKDMSTQIDGAGCDHHRDATHCCGGRGGLCADAARPAEPQYRVGWAPKRRSAAAILQELVMTYTSDALV